MCADNYGLGTLHNVSKVKEFQEYTSLFPSLLERLKICVPEILEYSSTAEQDTDDSDSDSDIQDTLSDAIDDLLSIAPQLMSLQESLPSEALPLEALPAEEEKATYPPLVIPADKPEDHFRRNLQDKYPNAPETVVHRFAEASWVLFQSIRIALVKRDEAIRASNMDRDSAYYSMMQSQMAPSLVGQLPRGNVTAVDDPDDQSDSSSISSVSMSLSSTGAPPIPKPPVAIGPGVSFVCPVCGVMQTGVDNTKKWL